MIPIQTSNITIPTFTQPTPVLSVNDWIVFQQRVDNSLDFNLAWAAYKTGFGTYDWNFWLGLEKLYQLTANGNYRLRIEVYILGPGSLPDIWQSDEYDSFVVESEALSYKIVLAGYNTGVGSSNYDVMASQNNMAFSTYDRDSSGGCLPTNAGGFWFSNSPTTCGDICLNCRYDEYFVTYSAVYDSYCYIISSRALMKRI